MWELISSTNYTPHIIILPHIAWLWAYEWLDALVNLPAAACFDCCEQTAALFSSRSAVCLRIRQDIPVSLQLHQEAPSASLFLSKQKWPLFSFFSPLKNLHLLISVVTVGAFHITERLLFRLFVLLKGSIWGRGSLQFWILIWRPYKELKPSKCDKLESRIWLLIRKWWKLCGDSATV